MVVEEVVSATFVCQSHPRTNEILGFSDDKIFASH
jgi:hypothetical protein